jgi:UDP-glucose 4-epimerase
MKILVTGGAGFIGSYVTKQLLDQGHKVIVYDNLSRGFKKLIDPRATFILGSISEKEKLVEVLSGVEAVIHMAAFIIVPESVEKPDLYWENNVVGTKVLLEAMGLAGTKKIIFSSSATVYDEPDKLPLTEESPVKKAENPYGQTKIEMERLIQKEHENNGLNAVILRYFNPYGPNELHNPETHAIPNFILATLNKKPIPLYWKGEQTRDFIYVEDLASSHIATLGLEGMNIFNVGTGSGTKVKDIVNKIFDIVGYSVPIQDLGERAGDVPSLYTSAEKIQKELGWKAKVSLEEGLKETIRFFKKI